MCGLNCDGNSPHVDENDYDLVEEVMPPAMSGFSRAPTLEERADIEERGYSSLEKLMENNKEDHTMYFQGEFIPGEEYEDRDGSSYTFISYHPKHTESSAIFQQHFDGEYTHRFDNGAADALVSFLDIIRHVPKPKKLTVWINIYPGLTTTIYKSREKADRLCKEVYSDEIGKWVRIDRIACIPVEIEYEEGEGL